MKIERLHPRLIKFLITLDDLPFFLEGIVAAYGSDGDLMPIPGAPFQDTKQLS